VSKVTQLKRSKPAANLDTPTDLDDKAVREISDALNGILADAFALYLKTKNFHWHMTGAALSRLSPIAGRSGGGNLLGC